MVANYMAWWVCSETCLPCGQNGMKLIMINDMQQQGDVCWILNDTLPCFLVCNAAIMDYNHCCILCHAIEAMLLMLSITPGLMLHMTCNKTAIYAFVEMPHALRPIRDLHNRIIGEITYIQKFKSEDGDCSPFFIVPTSVKTKGMTT